MRVILSEAKNQQELRTRKRDGWESNWILPLVQQTEREFMIRFMIRGAKRPATSVTLQSPPSPAFAGLTRTASELHPSTRDLASPAASLPHLAPSHGRSGQRRTRLIFSDSGGESGTARSFPRRNGGWRGRGLCRRSLCQRGVARRWDGRGRCARSTLARSAKCGGRSSSFGRSALSPATGARAPRELSCRYSTRPAFAAGGCPRPAPSRTGACFHVR